MYPVAVVLQYTVQYIQYTKTQNNTYTLKTIHNAIITNKNNPNTMHKRKQEYKAI
jgi:hypothetical protein